MEAWEHPAKHEKLIIREAQIRIAFVTNDGFEQHPRWGSWDGPIISLAQLRLLL